jgi:hypothetical protein
MSEWREIELHRDEWGCYRDEYSSELGVPLIAALSPLWVPLLLWLASVLNQPSGYEP